MSTSEESATDKVKNLPSEIQDTYYKVSKAIAQATSAIDNLIGFYNSTVNSIQKDSNYYSVNLYILGPDKKWAVLKAGTSDEAKSAIQHGHKLAVDGQSMVSRAINMRSVCMAMIKPENSPIPYPSVELPPVHSELCVPLISLQKDVIGVLDVQSTEYETFDEDECVMYMTVADHIVSMLDNKNLL